MNNIIDNPKDMLKLSRDELDEILIEKYNNSALLRELIRRCLKDLSKQIELSEYYYELASKKQDRLNEIKDKISDIDLIIYKNY